MGENQMLDISSSLTGRGEPGFNVGFAPRDTRIDDRRDIAADEYVGRHEPEVHASECHGRLGL
jgi:hypothetical protein